MSTRRHRRPIRRGVTWTAFRNPSNARCAPADFRAIGRGLPLVHEIGSSKLAVMDPAVRDAQAILALEQLESQQRPVELFMVPPPIDLVGQDGADEACGQRGPR